MSIQYKVVPKKNPQDLNAPAKYYAQVVYKEKRTLNDLALRISNSTSLNKTDVHAVLMALTDEIATTLKDGSPVELGELCIFYPALKSSAANTEAAFNGVSNITNKGVNVRPKRVLARVMDNVGVIKISNN